MKIAALLCAAGLAAATGAPALAADSTESADAVQSRIELAFGAAVTSNYVSRGLTQTEDKPAVQGYVEASYSIFYIGSWASNVSFAGTRDVEIDIYAGIRPSLGDLSLDLGYVHYYYPKDPTVYGELYAKGSYAVNDQITPGLEFYYDPHNETSWSAAKIEVGGLPAELSFSSRIGTDFGSQALGYDRVAWDAGVSRSFFDDTLTLDLRYHDANDSDARFAATLSVDFSTPVPPVQ